MNRTPDEQLPLQFGAASVWFLLSWGTMSGIDIGGRGAATPIDNCGTMP
jgi:hypothetical protein